MLCRLFWSQVGLDLYASSSEIYLSADDPRARKPDISRAKRILGLTPKVTTEEGLQKTIDYFRKSLA